MAGSIQTHFRACMMLLLVAAIVTMSVAAVAPIHGHSDLHQDACTICKASGVAFLSPPSAPQSIPIRIVQESIAFGSSAVFSSPDLKSSPSRGPPHS